MSATVNCFEGQPKYMIKKWLLLLLLLLFAVALGAQERRGAPENEQRNFSMEQEIVPIRVPAILPEGALLALASDRSVSSCLHKQNSSPTHPPATWFVASEIHLYAPDEIDLIVLPAILKAQRSMSPAPNACFIGPYTSRFWVLREPRRATISFWQLMHMIFRYFGPSGRVITR